MPKVTFITRDGEKVVVPDACGSLMEAAQDNEIDGIDGDCGGVCSCSTCHVYIAPEWVDKVGPAEEMELDTLEFNEQKKSCSRLSCQIDLTDELDGLVVEVAPADE